MEIQSETNVEDSPLGLNLSKSQSFCDFVTTKLSETGVMLPNFKPVQSEKLKASNIPAIFLKIGSWERVSAHEGDLIVKFYFAKKKIVWEILDRGLKSKIEIAWSDIEAMRGIVGENNYGIFEIMLCKPPLFYRESTPQPMKHTIWHSSSDFTCGQATTYRKHYVQFPRAIFDRHYEKLIQYDPRLFEISRRSFPTMDHLNPFFKCYNSTNMSFNIQPSDVPSQYYTMFPNNAYIQNFESSVIDFDPTNEETANNITYDQMALFEKITRHDSEDMHMMGEVQFNEIMDTKELFENKTYKSNNDAGVNAYIGLQSMWPETMDNMCTIIDQFSSYEQQAQWEPTEVGSSYLYYPMKSTI